MGDDIPDDFLEKLKFYRSETNLEFSLLGQRMTWFVTCQSFLITSYAISFGRSPTSANWFACILVPLVGLITAGLTLPSLWYACNTIDAWYEKQRRLLRASTGQSGAADVYAIPRNLSESAPADRAHNYSLLFPKLVGVVFILCWVAVLIFSSLKPWAKPA